MGAKTPLTAGIEDEYELNKEMADREEQDALYNARQRRKQGEMLLKDQVAAYGASGVELEGTVIDVMENDLKTAEIEAMNMVYSGKLKRNEMRRRAKLARDGAYTDLLLKGGEIALKGGAGGGAGKVPLGATGLKPDKAGGTTGYSRSYLED